MQSKNAQTAIERRIIPINLIDCPSLSYKDIVMQQKKPTEPTSEQSQKIQEAVALHQSGQLDAAETQYKKLLNFLPSNTMLLTNLGTIALQKGNLDDAVRIIGKSLEINPNQPNALNNRGTKMSFIQQPIFFITKVTVPFSQ